VFNLFDNWFEAARFGADVHRVMTLRVMRIASGGPDAAKEARDMVSEKLTAFGEAHMAALSALAIGSSLNVAAAKAYAPYRRRVRANRRRLGS
jgi:hypothetical protein